MPYQSNLTGNLWTSVRQRRATGGRPLTPGEMRGLLDPLAAAESRKAIAAGERDIRQANFNRQFGLQERMLSDQARAAKISGLTDIAGMGLAYKLGSQQNQLLGGLLGGANQGAVLAGGANMAQLGASTVPGIGSTLGQVGPMSVAGGEAAGGGFLSGIAPYAGPTALAAGGGLLGSSLLQGMGVNKDISQSLSYTAAGAALGSVVPGLGTALGAGIGLGISLLDDIGDFFGGIF